ncbi:DNA-binding domain-containing protein [Epilithonimonas arachidiradicis]|uniref:Uncharacterized protein with Ig-like fold DUF4469 n=1 Tax=Epilithonimonas arachidiradicis TaxID=1617282 RepID=A0A420CPG5_9FLAO|nr:DNA-binding domain-containing protein [Epilithonimonas arachidiradicis]RKE80310.1 uncharacterized protein with Ig-like fold DUF4469 [Epilithonimonas arachidiradicis]GGG64556.1 hypothetical protein GCM10007332_28710 [Epilithonimonas arachidiradicis]
MTSLHKIRAYLYDNVLTKDNSNDYIARTISERSLNIKQICEIAVTRGGADISASAMEYTIELFLKEMAYQLCDGYSINTGYFTAATKIRGVFTSPTETFDNKRHSILFQFNQGEKLRVQIQNIEVDILGMADATCSISQITDINSGSINHLLTPNRNLKIQGTKIKIVGDNPANGISFVNVATNERTKASTNDIAVNKPSELIIITPELASGMYQLQVTTQYTANSILLKSPRTIIFNKYLTVQ